MEPKMNEPLTEDQLSSARTKQSLDFKIHRFWHNLPVLIQAIIAGIVVFEVGNLIWFPILYFIPMPLSFFIMIGVFWVYLKYFSGSWRPKSTVEYRKANFRSIQLSIEIWKWGLVASTMTVVVIQAMMVLTFRFVDFPTELFQLWVDYDLYPIWAVLGFIVFAALTAGIFEEVGFRGYMQVPLEKRYGSRIAIGIVSIMFTVLHFNQLWAPSAIVVLIVAGILWGILAYLCDSLIPVIVAHVIVDITAYSYWWSGLAAEQKLETIFITGIDLHFGLWIVILIGSLGGFYVISRKISKHNQNG